jgi:hypothetical protein
MTRTPRPPQNWLSGPPIAFRYEDNPLGPALSDFVVPAGRFGYLKFYHQNSLHRTILSLHNSYNRLVTGVATDLCDRLDFFLLTIKMPPHNDIEKDLSEKDSFLNGSKHADSDSDADNTSDTTTQNSRGLLSNRKGGGRSRAKERGRFTVVLRLFSHCTGWIIVLVIQVGMLLVLYQRLPVKQTNFLNGDISHIVPECEHRSFI